MIDLVCARCEREIDPQFQGGYVEQVCLGRLRVPYHRLCWLDGEMSWIIVAPTKDAPRA